MIVRIPEVVPEQPAWADSCGVDRSGVFASSLVGQAEQVWRWIEPGSFVMGSPDGEVGRWSAEGPQHKVEIANGFWMGQTPVTQAFYEAVTGDNPSHFKGDLQRPVETVTWHDAVAFCEKLNAELFADADVKVRLPSEAEWEYACRAGTVTALYSGKEITSEHGDCPHVDELAWYTKNAGQTTHPVREKSPNAWGLYDMLGNVWEWCQDTWHGSYTDAPADGTAWFDSGGSGRVVRGGSWAYGARYCRCAYRFYWGPGNRLRSIGFRLVLSSSSKGLLSGRPGSIRAMWLVEAQL